MFAPLLPFYGNNLNFVDDASSPSDITLSTLAYEGMKGWRVMIHAANQLRSNAMIKQTLQRKRTME